MPDSHDTYTDDDDDDDDDDLPLTAAVADHFAAGSRHSCNGGGGESSSPLRPTADPLVREALGVTSRGTCIRHPNCPVLHPISHVVMSCRVCFSEEKSGGIRQGKSFAAVMRQLKQLAATGANDASFSETTAPVPSIVAASSDSKWDDYDYENNTLSAALDQEPHALEAIMKRLAQVQNWMMRQKEKEALSLQLHIHRLEQKLSDSEQTIQEQKQTIRALRRTIQQDLKLIKTMATQKERELVAAEAAAAKKKREMESRHLHKSPPAPVIEVPDEDATSVTNEEASNPTDSPTSENDPRIVSPAKRTPSSSVTGGVLTPDVTTPNSLKAPIDFKTPDQSSPLRSMLTNNSVQFRKPGKKPHAKHLPHRLPSLQGDSQETPRETGSRFEITVAPPDRSPYWSDTDMTLASHPSKIFASFRGGLLDIPKSPPPARHDSRQKLQLHPKDMAALILPESRHVSRHNSEQNPGYRNPGNKEIPLDVLAAKLSSLPLSRKIGDQSPEQFFKETAPGIDKSSIKGGPPPPPLSFSSPEVKNARKPQRMPSYQLSGVYRVDDMPSPSEGSFALASPQKTVAEPSAIATVDDVVPTEVASISADVTVNSDEVTQSVPSDVAVSAPAEVTAPASTIAAHGHDVPVGDERTLSTYADEMDGYSSAMRNDLVDGISVSTNGNATRITADLTITTEQLDDTGSDKFIFSVTNARCQDKYGDKGEYTGSILVTEGMPHGVGTMNYDSGRVYSGDWASGQWHGKGKLLNPNGDTYEGSFVFDARHGEGVYKWDNCDIYEGSFAFDKRHGKGKFSFHNGNVYEGDFVDGMFDGFGKYSFQNGVYEGEWKAGRYHGSGELVYSNGGKYTGAFRNSVAHGFGMEVTADGRKRRGVWEDGQPVDYFERG